MAKYLVADGAISTLASGVSSGATSVTVEAGDGALFPQPNTSTGTQFFATFVSASNPNTKEVVTCTARSTDTMTITATTQAWAAGDTFAILNLAEMLEQLVQFDDLQAQAGNYALDTGSANAYAVVLTPALTAHVDGMPIRWRAAHTNTGASTFSDGVSAESLVLPGGEALPAGIVQENVIYESAWNAEESYFQLNWAIISEFSQLAGQATDAQIPESAVTQYADDILANAALTGTPTAPTAATGNNTTQVATTAFTQTAATNAAAAAANPGSSIGPTGYKTYIDGYMKQWGSLTTNSGNVTVTFAQPFPTGCINVLFQGILTGYYTCALTEAPSKTSFTVNTDQLTTGQTLYWEAAGY